MLALGVVLATTWFISDKAKTEARQSLEDQIKRHLKDASVEAAATIGERFRKLQYGVLDVTAFALRDALEEVSSSSCVVISAFTRSSQSQSSPASRF